MREGKWEREWGGNEGYNKERMSRGMGREMRSRIGGDEGQNEGGDRRQNEGGIEEENEGKND